MKKKLEPTEEDARNAGFENLEELIKFTKSFRWNTPQVVLKLALKYGKEKAKVINSYPKLYKLIVDYPDFDEHIIEMISKYSLKALEAFLKYKIHAIRATVKCSEQTREKALKAINGPQGMFVAKVISAYGDRALKLIEKHGPEVACVINQYGEKALVALEK